jgi:hypothetical protein
VGLVADLTLAAYRELTSLLNLKLFQTPTRKDGLHQEIPWNWKWPQALVFFGLKV